MDRLMAGAQGAGLVSQQPELTHLVTTIRQEWDKDLQTFQYQLQSFTNNNEYFIIDLGTHLDAPDSKLLGADSDNVMHPKQRGSFVDAGNYAQPTGEIQYQMKWRFS
jgi:hypothetical protein